MPPPLDADEHRVWALFCDLDRWRGAGGMGPMPLTLHDLAAYEARFGVRLAASTVELVKQLDAVHLAPDEATP